MRRGVGTGRLPTYLKRQMEVAALENVGGKEVNRWSWWMGMSDWVIEY